MFKVIFGTIGAVLLVFALVIFLSASVFGLRWQFADTIGRGEAEITINSGNMRIQAYDHFFDLCSSIQANEFAIDVQDEMLGKTSGIDAQNRVLKNIAALQTLRTLSITKYNSDASKDYTIGQFRSVKLPFNIPLDQYTPGGVKTTCT